MTSLLNDVINPSGDKITGPIGSFRLSKKYKAINYFDLNFVNNFSSWLTGISTVQSSR